MLLVSCTPFPYMLTSAYGFFSCPIGLLYSGCKSAFDLPVIEFLLCFRDLTCFSSNLPQDLTRCRHDVSNVTKAYKSYTGSKR